MRLPHKPDFEDMRVLLVIPHSYCSEELLDSPVFPNFSLLSERFLLFISAEYPACLDGGGGDSQFPAEAIGAFCNFRFKIWGKMK